VVPGEVTMARPKKGAKKVDRPADERVAIIHLKGTVAYAEWLERLHRKTLIPKAAMVRDAMREWCERRKYETPPEL
jgi:hypothetical protein